MTQENQSPHTSDAQPQAAAQPQADDHRDADAQPEADDHREADAQPEADAQLGAQTQLPNAQANNPLHGVKLVDILEYLVEHYGWQELSERINIRCFTTDPSIKSSLKFLRQTQWARDKVERLYLRSLRQWPKQ